MKAFLRWIPLALLIVVAAGAVWLAHVHATTGEWSLMGSEAPPRIEVGGRRFDRAPSPGLGVPLPAHPVEVGTTGGGAPILETAGDTNPVILWVRQSDGQAWDYSLSGSR